MSSWGWRPYVSVGERREQAKRHINNLEKRGLRSQPVNIQGTKIARTFWGNTWCNHLESFSDYANRLPRGRTYVRNGSVVHLEMKAGEIKAIVSGSEIYDVKITITELANGKWDSIKRRCSGQIASLLALLQGKLSDGVMSIVAHRKEGLFPLPSEIKMDCSCPDWAEMCKHVAATLYGVGARLDDEPQLLFVLRGVNHQELVDADAVLARKGSAGRGRRIADSELEGIFGIEIVEPMQPETSVSTTHDISPRRRSSNAKASAETQKSPDKAKRPATGRKRAPVGSPYTLFRGAEIRKLRLKFEMSQEEFAQLLDVSTISVYKWETKKSWDPTRKSRDAIIGASKLTKTQAWQKLQSMR